MSNPNKVIVKILTTAKSADDAFVYFADMKNMERGGVLKSVAIQQDDWWTADTPAGKARLKHTRVSKEHGVLDHVFVGGGLTWDAYARVVPNRGGSTVSWTFVKPDGMSDGDFEEQLKMFDVEIANWKRDIESRR
jgi:hypothetical protein